MSILRVRDVILGKGVGELPARLMRKMGGCSRMRAQHGQRQRGTEQPDVVCGLQTV